MCISTKDTSLKCGCFGITIMPCDRAKQNNQECRMVEKKYIERDEYCDDICRRVWSIFPDKHNEVQADARLTLETELRVGSVWTD